MSLERSDSIENIRGAKLQKRHAGLPMTTFAKKNKDKKMCLDFNFFYTKWVLKTVPENSKMCPRIVK